MECVAETLPEPVCARARLFILDTLACGLAGSRTDAGRAMANVFFDMGGHAQSTILGFGTRLPAPHASYVNAFLGNLHDLDDVYRTLAHPGLSAVFPAIAVAESVHASDADLLAAVVVGYEVAIRIAEAIRPTPERAGVVWGLSTPQVFGAAAASARLLGLDRSTTRAAFGLAGLNAPVPSLHKMGMEPQSRPVSWVKNNICWAAMAGVLAVLQAARGIVGNRDILEGSRGFWVMAGSDRYDPALASDGLGDRFLMLRTAIKPWGCCRWTHSAIEAAERLARGDVAADEVEAIEVATFEPASTTLAPATPASFIDMQWSLPLLIAVTLKGGDLRAGTSDAQLRDPAIRALAARVRIVGDPRFTERFVRDDIMGARVTVRTRSGEERTEEVMIPEGGEGRELEAAQVLQKYHRLADAVLGKERARRIADRVLHLEGIRDAHDLLD